MCMHVPMEARRWLWISGVRGEAPDVSARIQTQILCERSTHSQLPRSLSPAPLVLFLCLGIGR